MRKLLSFVLIIMGAVAALGFDLKPIKFEQRIDGPGGYQEFYLTNSGNSTLRYRVSALPGGKGRPTMHQWVEVSPKILSVKPGQVGTVKVFANAPSGLAEGEYSFHLNMRTVPAPKLPEEPDGGAVGAQAKLGLDVSIELLGYAGDLKPQLKIESYKIREDKEGKTVLDLVVKNNTRKRGVDYRVDILEKNGSYISVEAGRIKENERSEFSVTLKKTKKGDIAGIRLRDGASFEDLAMVKVR